MLGGCLRQIGVDLGTTRIDHFLLGDARRKAVFHAHELTTCLVAITVEAALGGIKLINRLLEGAALVVRLLTGCINPSNLLLCSGKCILSLRKLLASSLKLILRRLFRSLRVLDG